MTYQEALAYLEQASSFGIKPGLERITALMEALGNPQEDYKIVHVTGTNGKGSVTSYISYALFTSGLRVGRFTSPHLQSYTERIQINDGNITEEAFGKLISRVKIAVDTIISNGIEAPTQFEILTAAAFLFFKDQGVDYAVVEVGLGGLLDSTNIVTPKVSVITNVTIDHQAYCGDTVEEIARHKAGIIKPKVPVVTSRFLGRHLATCAALSVSWALYTPPGPRWRAISRHTTEGLGPIGRAVRTWDKPASNPTIIAARSSTLSIRRQLTISPSSSTATTQIVYTL